MIIQVENPVDSTLKNVAITLNFYTDHSYSRFKKIDSIGFSAWMIMLSEI